MRRVLVAITLAIVFSGAEASAADKAQAGIYELRIYTANPGKLEALHARFRNHTARIFEKHGMTNVGYFVPNGENKDSKLIYFLSYPSKEAREKAWKAFIADPEWKKVFKESQKNGPLVKNVVSRFLVVADYSPKLKIEGKGGRIFELRRYTTTKGNLGALDARFRDHTMKLFEKHGMTNIAYWHLAPGSKDVERTLVYILAHKNVEARGKSFASFAKDPAWVAAKKASEVKAGGPLTEPKGGVVYQFIKPTNYSPLK